MRRESSETVHIIAEAGTNYNGNVCLAKKLIRLASQAGADSVKFQIINPDTLYLPGTYKFGHYDIEHIRQIRRSTQMTDDQWYQIAEYADHLRIPFSASAFDRHGLGLMKRIKPPYFKIASTDLNNLRFLRSAAQIDLPIILSTGMSSLSDIEKAVEEIVRAGAKSLTLMHCVSAYPTRLDQMNLSFIDVLSSAFGFPVGLSDHTQSSIAACLALTKGVSYIEKHFTFDKSSDGLDHAYAAENDEFVRYVDDVRSAQLALKPANPKIGREELFTQQRARRSLYAARSLPAGHLVLDHDVLVVRPQSLMTADQIDLIVGKTINSPIEKFEPFTPEVIAPSSSQNKRRKI